MVPRSANTFIIPRYYVLVIVSVISSLALLKMKVNIKRFFLIPLILFLFWGGISSLFAQDKYASWIGIARLIAFSAKIGDKPIFFAANVYYYTGLLTYIMCAILFLFSTKASEPNKLLKYLVTSSSCVALLGVLQYIGIDIVPWNDTARPLSSTMGNPNFLGTLMVFVLPGSMMLYLLSGKSVWLLSSGLIFGGLTVSNTRGTWITFIVMFILIICYVMQSNLDSKKQRIRNLCIVFFIVLCILLPLRDGTLIKRIFSISDELLNSIKLRDEGGSYRIYTWKEVIKILKSNWLFGIGLDNLIFEKIVLPGGSVAAKAHSNILEIAVTMGIPALIAYLSFLLLVFLEYRKYNYYQIIYLMMSFSYLFQGLANIDMIMIYPLFWIVLGLSIACADLGKKKNAEQ